jgi:hypothetical protein
MDERAIKFLKIQGTEAETRAAWEVPGSAIRWSGLIGWSCSYVITAEHKEGLR